MGSRSGKRLTNEQRKENRRRRLKFKQKNKPPRPSSHTVPPEYGEVHQAIREYVITYVNSFHSKPSYLTLMRGAGARSVIVREPVEGQETFLDIKRIDYEKDWCTVDANFHEQVPSSGGSKIHAFRQPGRNSWKAHSQSPVRWSMCFSDPNFFPLLRVFLDKILAQYWGCGSYSGEIAKAGGVLDYCVPDLERSLDARNYELAKIERSEGPLDLAPSYELRRNGRSLGSLAALDGFVRYGSVKEPMAWIAKGYTHAFASRVAKEVMEHDTGCSNDRLYRSSQEA